MKLALVHDWFNTKPGGAEAVMYELAELFPDAPIYTLIFNHSLFAGKIDPRRVRTSFLQRAPAALKAKPRYLLPLIPAAVRSLRFDQFDVVLSSSSAWVKNIHTPANTTHICYCHTPMRFAWDYEQEYLDEQQIGPLRQAAAIKLVNWVRRWDLKGSKGVDRWLANSKTTAARIREYYGQNSQVIYPPVRVNDFQPQAKKKDYYITLASLSPYKRIDLAIEACNIGGRQLYVIGDGADRKRLEALAGPTIRFSGYVSDAKKRKLLAEARGMIYANIEDFGIAPVEAMASGTPLIAYRRGGLSETIVEGKTGIFFDQQTPEALSEALDKFEKLHFSTNLLVARAKYFDRQHFDEKIKAVVNEAKP